jgi:RNA polymerase sigma factor (sigma-70 family)
MEISLVDRVEEQRLLQRAQHGDADAFATLYRANVQAIFRYIYHRLNDSHLAEDLTSDVFVQAVKGLGGYVDQGKPFVAWLYRIAHARIVDHYRRTGRRPVESDIEEEVIAVHPEMDQALARRQAAKTLSKAIAFLTDEQQQVIVLRFIEGYSLEKVAQLMDKKPNAIKSLQRRGLHSLANRLSRSGVDLDAIIEGLS